jgi:gas vesicle protein
MVRRTYMERECSGHGSAGVVLSFLAGGLIGAAAAILLAPKSGKETREQIKGMAEEVKETTADYYERVKKLVVSALENGQELLEEKKDLIASAVQAGIETYEKKKQDKNAESGGESSPN